MVRLQNILIVEDDPAWRQMLTEIFDDLGCQIETASDQIQAQELIELSSFDLALLDLSLNSDDPNNLDGLGLLANIHKRQPSCKCIMMTGFATVEIAVKAIVEFGAINFIRKENFSISDFLSLIKEHFILDDFNEKVPGGVGNERNVISAKQVSKPVKALIVEDSADWRSIHVEILEEMGLDVIECSSYGQAIGQLNRGNFSIILLDLNLQPAVQNGSTIEDQASLEGIKLLARLRDLNTPIIIVSGLSSPEMIDSVYQDQNIFAFFEKQNFDRELLKKALQEAIEDPSREQISSELTIRENEVLDLVIKGMTNKEIAVKLFITPNTVKRHLKAIFTKLDVHTRSGAVSKAISRT